MSEKVTSSLGPFLSWDLVFSFIFKEVTRGHKYQTNVGQGKNRDKKEEKKVYPYIKESGGQPVTLGTFPFLAEVCHA